MLIAESAAAVSHENKASETLSERKREFQIAHRHITELQCGVIDGRMPTHHTPVMCARQEFWVCGSLTGGDGARWFLVRRALLWFPSRRCKAISLIRILLPHTRSLSINMHQSRRISLTRPSFFSGPLHIVCYFNCTELILHLRFKIKEKIYPSSAVNSKFHKNSKWCISQNWLQRINSYWRTIIANSFIL